MPKTVSATEAKNSFGSITEWVSSNNDAVVIENHGTERFALITFAEYQTLLELKELRRREEGLKRLRAIQSDRNSDLTDDEIMDIAVEAVREVRAEMTAELRAAADNKY